MGLNPERWEIDDTVYFLNSSSTWGGFPTIHKGTVEEITRCKLRVKDIHETREDLLYILNREDCFKSLDSLMTALNEQMMAQANRDGLA